MAKRTSRPPRVTPATRYWSPVRAVVASPLRFKSPTPKATLSLLDDRRQWHPLRWARPVVGLRRAATRLVVGKSPKLLPPTLAFADPRRVVVCLRRKIRREVLHALGKGGGGNRRPTRKPTSEIQC